MDNNLNNKNRDWVYSYLNNMISEKYEEGLEIKAKHFPNSFFKYKKLDFNILDSIENKQIWLADIESLNDPFECSLQFDIHASFRKLFLSDSFKENFNNKFGFNLSQDQINEVANSSDPNAKYYELCTSQNIVFHKTIQEQVETIKNAWLKTITEMNQNLKVTCFSERNDSLLMWAHYADEYKGICIEYDMIGNDIVRPFLQPVIYSENIFKIDTFEELTALNHILASLYKSIDWAYEQEWRLTIFKQNDHLPKVVDVPIPKAIYLGTRFDKNKDELKSKLMEIAKAQNIPVYKMQKHDTEYKLVRKEPNLM